MKKLMHRLVKCPSGVGLSPLARTLWVLSLLAVCGLGGALPVAAQQCTVYPSKTFTMTPSKPTTQEDLFSTTNLRGTFTLIVHNGNARDENGRVVGDQLVSSGNIYLNGVEVVRESELKQNVAQIQKVVSLQASNKLQVTLKGGAGKNGETPPFITVTIVRHIDETAGPVISITQPTANQVVASSPLTVTGTLTDESDIGSLSVNGVATPVVNGTFSAQVALTPGQNTITLVAKDCQGSSSTKTVQTFYDTLPPNLTLTSPADGLLTTAGTIQVTGTATDDGAVASLTVNGQPVALAGNAFTASVSLAEGANPINAVATDTTGKQTTVSVRATRDTILPVINILAPGAGQIFGSSPVAVSGTATDANGVSKLTVNGTPATNTNGTFSAQAALNPGQNTLNVSATDFEGGNTATKSVQVIFDTLPPVLTVTSPAASHTTKAQTLHVAGTVTDDGQVTGVTVNGQPATLDGNNFSATVALAEGVNNINVVATDTTGKQTTSAVAVTSDTTPPVVTIVTPTPEQIFGDASVAVSGTATDSSGISSLTVNGTTAPVVNGTFNAQVTLTPGQNNINVVATDFPDGNTTARSVRALLDTTPPQLSITSPEQGRLTKTQALQITGTIADDGALASLTVNGQPVVPSGNNFNALVTLAEGVNDISVVATDTTGKQTTAHVTATLDTIAPALNVVSPTANQFLAVSPVTVVGTVADPNGVVTLTVNGQPVPVLNGAFTTQVALNSGQNTIVVEAQDFVGGNTATLSVPVVFDSAPPSVAITSPANNLLTRNQTLQVTGTVTDDGTINSVTVNGQPATINGNTFAATLVLNEGANPVSVVATDAAGKQGTASVNVTLDSMPPTLNVVSPTPGQTVSDATVHINGNVSDASGIASLTINGVAVTPAGVMFDYDLPLALGATPLVVSATDTAGNLSTVNLTVNRFTTLDVTITSPAPQALFSSKNVTVTGTADANATSVEVNRVQAVLSGGHFTAANVPLHEGANILTATASNNIGSVGTASINVLLDSSSPIVHIDAPTEGAVLTTSAVTVTGMVNDVVSGTVNGEQVSVTVNGIPATVSNRTFVVPDLLLVRGANVITAVARDDAGNESRMQVRVNVQDIAGQQRILMVSGNNQSGVIGSQLPNPLTVQLVDAYGTPLAEKVVNFKVRRSDGILRAPSLPEGQEIKVKTDANGQASARFQVGTRLGVGNNEVEVTSPGFSGEIIFTQDATVGSPATITGAMVMGESMRGIVGKPLPMPFQALVTDQGGNPVAGVPVTFTVTQGGGHLEDGLQTRTVNTDGDGKVSTLLTLGAEAGINNNAVATTYAGMTGDPLVFNASGVVARAASDTRVSGVVLDNTNQPIPGATAKIVGTELSAISDAQGQFVIHNAPVGTITLIVDGKTSPRSEIFPFLAFQLLTVPGQDNTVGMPIFMPPLDTANSKTVGGNEDVTLTMKDVPGVAFTIYANSVTDAAGKKYVGPLSISQVHADKVPMPPPNGTSPKVVWTLQPAGLHFNKPIKVQLPNTDGLVPGQVVEVFSFDHALEQFVSGGMARVSADGSVIVSDPGFGIHVSGWGAPAPPPPPRSCASNCAERAAPCVIGTCDDGICKFSPKPQGARCDEKAGGCFTGVCDGAGKCMRDNQQPDGTKCDDGNRCSLGDQCGKDSRGNPSCVPTDTNFVNSGCCFGKEYDPNNFCCIHRTKEVLPNKPNDVERCENPAQNDRAHQYDGCSVPQAAITIAGPFLGTLNKDNPAGGDYTRFSNFPGGPFEGGGAMACDLHDTCYQTCKQPLPGGGVDVDNQHACDDILHDKAVATCMDPRNDKIVLVPQANPFPLIGGPIIFVPQNLQSRCLNFAALYTTVLKRFGGGAYKERQEQYCNCCHP